MDLVYLKKLLRIFDESTLSELSIEEEGVNVKLARTITGAGQAVSVVAPAMHYPAPVAHALPPTPASSEPAASSKEPLKKTHTILSPIVGTFYRAPAPDADPFVKVGDRISVGQTLCIVEAMKLMNEIESDASGTIVKILVDNQSPIEYNQPLFEVDPD